MLEIGSKITQLRKQKGWGQDELADAIKASRSIIGKYERNENTPSLEAAISLAEAFDITLDYLVGNGKPYQQDKKMLQRLEEIDLLDEQTKKELFNIIDTYIRDAKTRKAYSK